MPVTVKVLKRAVGKTFLVYSENAFTVTHCNRFDWNHGLMHDINIIVCECK